MKFIDCTKNWQKKFEYHGAAYVPRTPNSLDRQCFKTEYEYRYAVGLQKQFIDNEILLWLYRPYTIIFSDESEFTFTFYRISMKAAEWFDYFVYGEREEILLSKYQQERPFSFRPRLKVIDVKKEKKRGGMFY